MPERNFASIGRVAESALVYLRQVPKTISFPYIESSLYGGLDKQIENYENWIFRYESNPNSRCDMSLWPDMFFNHYMTLGRFGQKTWRNKNPWEMTPTDINERAEYLKQVEAAYTKNKAKLKQLKERAYQQRRMENDLNKERAQEIGLLEKEIQTILEQSQNYERGVLEFANNLDSIKFIRIHSDTLNFFLNNYYEKQYDELWLHDQDYIRALEAGNANVDSFINLISYKRLRPAGGNRTRVLTKEHVMGYSRKRIFTNWYAPVKEENERKIQLEQLRLEEESKRELEKKRLELEQLKRAEEARLLQFQYNTLNVHRLDKLLSFNKDTHTYVVKGKRMDSVTTIVSNAFPKFDAEKHAKYIAARNGMTVGEVIEMWEKKGLESRDQGTLLHEKIEHYYQGIDSPNDSAFDLFKQFAEKIKLKPYRTEWSVYDYDLGIAGTIDFVDFQNGEYSIYDWKRSEKLVENGLPIKINKYGEKGNYPLEHLDNSTYYHYALQLGIYKYILERNYGIKITHLRLGIFHPSYTKPYLLEMPYLQNEVNSIFSLRSEIILLLLSDKS